MPQTNNKETERREREREVMERYSFKEAPLTPHSPHRRQTPASSWSQHQREAQGYLGSARCSHPGLEQVTVLWQSSHYLHNMAVAQQPANIAVTMFGFPLGCGWPAVALGRLRADAQSCSVLQDGPAAFVMPEWECRHATHGGSRSQPS